MTPALIDFGHLEMIGGMDDPELREIMEEFIAEIPGYLERARVAIAAGDSGLLREAAHSIRGISGSLGFMLIFHTAAEADTNTPTADPQEWFSRLSLHCEESVKEWIRLKGSAPNS